MLSRYLNRKDCTSHVSNVFRSILEPSRALAQDFKLKLMTEPCMKGDGNHRKHGDRRKSQELPLLKLEMMRGIRSAPRMCELTNKNSHIKLVEAVLPKLPMYNRSENDDIWKLSIVIWLQDLPIGAASLFDSGGKTYRRRGDLGVESATALAKWCSLWIALTKWITSDIGMTWYSF